MAATWIDLLDPTHEELKAKSPRELEETALEVLLDRPEHDDEPQADAPGPRRLRLRQLPRSAREDG